MEFEFQQLYLYGWSIAPPHDLSPSCLGMLGVVVGPFKVYGLYLGPQSV